MAWKVEGKKKVTKFIEKQDITTQQRIRKTINTLANYLDNGIHPYNEMCIERLHGKSKELLKVKVGKFRILLKIDTGSQIIKIHKYRLPGRCIQGLT